MILPVSSPKELIRLGGTEDGAYILPDDLKDIYACFSPGVSTYKSFEDELSLKYKIKSFLCDYSTDPSKLSTPLIKDFQFFDKKFLGNRNRDNYITLEDWVNKYSPEKSDDLILQMDIEGAEYESILNTPQYIFDRFRIIIIELHNFGLFAESKFHREQNIINKCLEILNINHNCVHAHPNNCCPQFINKKTKRNIPFVIELTYLRKDRFLGDKRKHFKPCLPNPLDITNVKNKPPLFLNKYWNKNNEINIYSRLKILEDKLIFNDNLIFSKLSQELINIRNVSNIKDQNIQKPNVNINSEKNIYISTNKKKLHVIIPSRNSEKQKIFLNKSVGSVINQKLDQDIEISVIICTDPTFNEENIPSSQKIKIQICQSNKPTHADALNNGIKKFDANYVSFLEDDDYWQPNFIEVSLSFLKKMLSKNKFGMTSSNQLEINSEGQVIRVNDFPTPSGWLMTAETLSHVGLFNSSYLFHLDNDWLGKAALKNVPRKHLIEAVAPINVSICSQVRPWLALVVRNSKRTCSLQRHQYLTPLVTRLVHSQSGMGQISAEKSKQDLSSKEQNLLRTTYGLIPW